MPVQKLLTVAVPAYNSEEYLSKCLDSFCEGSVLPRLEVIVVNDGSSDETSGVACRYAEKYPDTFRVIDKENGGHGSAINRASREATGKYFQVVDSDDWVITESLPKLFAVLEAAEADVVLCNYHMVDKTTGKRQPFATKGVPLGVAYTVEQFMTFPQSSRQCCYFHGILYRTEFYRSTGIQLSERTFYEDQEYAAIPLFYAKTILPTDLFLYQYQVGNVNQSISNANQVKHLNQLEKILWGLVDFYLANKESMTREKQDYFLFKLSNLAISYYTAGFLKDPDRKRGYETARTMRKAVWSRCPDVAQEAERGYRTALFLYRLHLSADVLETAKRSKLYYRIRNHI